MKLVISFVVLALAGLATLAQDGKVVAEVMARGDGSAVKGQPFSADAVSESVQTLADGNRIVHSSTSKYYRSGDGRVRREMTGGSGGIMGTFFNYETGVSIMDPSGFRYMVDDGMKTARVLSALPTKELSIARTPAPLTDEQKAAIVKLKGALKNSDGKLSDEQKAELEKLHIHLGDIERNVVVTGDGTTVIRGTGTGGGLAVGGAGGMLERHPGPKFDTKTDLGTRSIEGVDCEGTRRVTTIPAGAIGNERPIETTYERWYSKELGVVVYSKNTDPRMGDQTYRLTNIVRAEPDPSLFTLPNGYKVISEPGDVYKVTTTVRKPKDQ